MPRAAAHQAARGQPAAAAGAMTRKRFCRVFGAARVEAASARQQGAHAQLIRTHAEAQEIRDHLSSPPSSLRNCLIMSAEASIRSGGRTSTSSGPSFSCSSRKASRMQRFREFRSEAAALCRRETRIPSRGDPAARRSMKKVYPSARRRFPSRSSRSKSALRRSRLAAPSPKRFVRVAAATIARADVDRGRDGCAALCVRLECGCALGSRGAGRAVSWRVDMCAW